MEAKTDPLLSMIEHFGPDARRANHALKVKGFAEAIALSEGLDGGQREIVRLCAVLHDIGIKEAELKHGSTSGKYQEIEGPPIARGILERAGSSAEAIERICFIIGHHHSYDAIDGLDFQILVEADFIVNAFEDGLKAEAIRAFSERYFRTAGGLKILRGLYPLS
jgi:uncharacterized protein